MGNRYSGILADSTTTDGLEIIKSTLEKNGRTFFDPALDEQNLDAILSINNYHAGVRSGSQISGIDGTNGSLQLG